MHQLNGSAGCFRHFRPGGGGGVHMGVGIFIQCVGFHERIHHDQPDPLGFYGFNNGGPVRVGDGETVSPNNGHAHAALAAGMQEDAPRHIRARDLVADHQRGEAALGFFQRVLQVQHPGGDGMMDFLRQEILAGGQRQRLAEHQRGFAHPAGCDQNGDETADQRGAIQPFARRDLVRVRQGGRHGGQDLPAGIPVLPERVLHGCDQARAR